MRRQKIGCWVRRKLFFFLSFFSLPTGKLFQSFFTVPIFGWILFFVVYWTIGLLFLIVDIEHVPGFVWRRKFQKKRPYQIGGSPFQPSLARTVFNALANQIFVFLPGMLLLHKVSLATGFGIRVDPVLPSLKEILITAITLITCVEIGFYYSHRLLHIKSLYQFHKTHHNYVTPIALSAIYSHPVEAFVSSVCSIISPAFYLRIHLSLFYLAIAIGWATTCRSHSGYGGFDTRISHDLHHSKNTGNYGLSGILDYLNGTQIKHPS
jgi:sterol desaturase/sphingolipid hydroxylase (fatty acid hydroxylase superfamily)